MAPDERNIAMKEFKVTKETAGYKVVLGTINVPFPMSETYDYFGEAVYTCDKHALSCQGFALSGYALE